jgi:hypothetical protein
MAVLIPGVVFAQVDAYHFTGINFNFANPGARARGIGGAFVALADDATASLANPAGLAFLDRQFSLEFIHDEELAPVGQITQGGVVRTGSPGNFLYTAENDPFRVWGESKSNRINYASFVFPVPKWRVGLAIYYSSLADLTQEYEVGAGLWCVDRDQGSPYSPNGGESCRHPGNYQDLYAPQTVSARLETNLLGAGFGWKLSDVFSIGLSAAYVKTTFSGASISDPTEYEPDWDIFNLTSEVDDKDVMFSAGILYRGNIVGFGLSYRSETRFDIFNAMENLTGSIGEREFDGEFLIPERFAGGIAFFPSDNWVIALEYVRLPYSEMPKWMPEQFDINRQQNGVEYAMADVTEYHIGFEYTTFTDNKGWSIRVGYWRDQTHLIFSSQGFSEPLEADQDFIQAGAALLYPEFELEFDHFTAGIGAAFGSVRFDAAVDYSSDAGTDFLLSGVLYF